MAYTQKKSMIAGTDPVKKAKEKKIKEIKGTSIFGKSPKDFAKSIGKHALNMGTGGLSGIVQKKYQDYKKSKKTKATKRGAVIGGVEAAMEGVGGATGETVGKVGGKMMGKEKGKLMARQSMKKVAKPVEEKRTMTDETKMKPPYKKPVGPRTKN